MMDYISIEIVTCPSNFSAQNYPSDVMKLLPEDHKDFPYLFNDECETWDVQDNIQYQYNLMRAQTQGYQWFFLDSDKRDFDLIRETYDTKLFLPTYNGKFFIPFPVEHNNKLVQSFQKEKKDKEIYEASGCHGQQTPPFPSTDLSMKDSSDIFYSRNVQDEENVTVTKSSKSWLEERHILPKYNCKLKHESLVLSRL